MVTIAHGALSPDISEFVLSIVDSTPGIDSIWLIGSRVNGTAKPESDWDFIVFGTYETLEHLKSAIHLHRHDVDFLIVNSGTRFQAGWGTKAGDLVEWEWSQISQDRSTYTETKWIDREDGAGWTSRQRQGIRIWSIGDVSPSTNPQRAP